MSDRILVTGGAGFVASHLIPFLLEHTSCEVVAIDDFNDYYSPEMKRANASEFDGDSRVTLEAGDFCDAPFVDRIMSSYRPRYLIHLGAYPGVPLSLKNPGLYVQNNINGTICLLDAARTYPVERFLFASSSTVYGLGVPAPFAESGPAGVPASPYGATKRTAEILGQTYHQVYGVPFTALRLFNAYGPRLRPDLALSIFTRKILADETITLYGDGSVQRDFTHVSDICAGILSALTAEGIAGEAINLGNNNPIKVRRLIALIEQFAGKKAIIEHREPRPGDMPFTCADLSKAQRLLGYSPAVPIEQGVEEYVHWKQNVQAPY